MHWREGSPYCIPVQSQCGEELVFPQLLLLIIILVILILVEFVILMKDLPVSDTSKRGTGYRY
jgi:hypothetical protein